MLVEESEAWRTTRSARVRRTLHLARSNRTRSGSGVRKSFLLSGGLVTKCAADLFSSSRKRLDPYAPDQRMHSISKCTTPVVFMHHACLRR